MTNRMFKTVKTAHIAALAAVLCLFMFATRTVHAGGTVPSSGNATESITITISIDDTGMVTSAITSPSDGFAFSTSTVTIYGTSASSNGAVADVQISIDSGPWISVTDTGTNFDTWEYATSSLTTGSHTVTSRALNEFDSTSSPSPVVNFSTTSDATPPDQIAAVNDGIGADMDYASSTTTLSANWSASADTGTGIAAYYYSIGTTAGASDVVSWTSLASDTTVFTNSSLSLSDGNTYYVSVKAEDGVGLFSTPTVSDGILIDSIAPEIADNQSGDDTARSSNVALYDVDFSDSGGSTLDRFQVRACSTNSNCGDIADWTDAANAIATNTYATDWALPAAVWTALPEGTSYVSTRAFDMAENSAESGPVFYVIKNTGTPTFGGISTIADTMQGGTLQLSWSEAVDSSPPITYNIYSATTSAGQNFASPPFATTSATSTYITSLTNDQVYYIVVRAENALGNEETNTVELATAPTCVPDLSITQSVSNIQDPLGGSDPIPGARVSYSIYYENSPSLCHASNAVIIGYIPPDTGYETGTIELDNVAQGDGTSDGDNCAAKTSPDRVECAISNIPRSASGTVNFNVIIK